MTGSVHISTQKEEVKVAKILLESSYSLLELSIRATKKGLDRVARCVFFLVFRGYDMVDAHP